MHSFAKKIKKGQNGITHVSIGSSPKEIEYSSEDNISFSFLLKFIMFTFYFQILAKDSFIFLC
jgi:hypothetical protein